MLGSSNRLSWKFKIEYETAILPLDAPSGCQLMDVAVLFTSLGSLKTARPFALGGSER